MPTIPPSGVPLIDHLSALPGPTLQDYIDGVSEYIRTAGQLSQSSKKIAQVRSSAALGRVVLAELRARLPGLTHAEAGERTVSGALRTAQADVSEMHPLDGLRLAIEIKPVLLAVGRAIWNRFGDVRTFAVNLHLKFPFAVVGGLMPVPTWEELPNPGSGSRKDTTALIAKLLARFARAGSRETEGDAPHLLEAIGVVVFDPESSELSPQLPPVGSGLRWEEFLDTLAAAYTSVSKHNATASSNHGCGLRGGKDGYSKSLRNVRPDRDRKVSEIV